MTPMFEGDSGSLWWRLRTVMGKEDSQQNTASWDSQLWQMNENEKNMKIHKYKEKREKIGKLNGEGAIDGSSLSHHHLNDII